MKEAVILQDLVTTNKERKIYEKYTFELLELYGAEIKKIEVN